MTHLPTRALVPLVLAATALLVLPGCTSSDGGATRSPDVSASGSGRPDGSGSPSNSTSGVGSAADALALGGLHLPAGAKNATVEVVAPTDDSPYEEHYRVTFTAPQASAVAFCGTGALGGDLPAVTLTEADRIDLGEAAAVVAGSRYCGSQDPAHSQWNRTALVTPGDPATVLVSVGRMKR